MACVPPSGLASLLTKKKHKIDELRFFFAFLENSSGAIYIGTNRKSDSIFTSLQADPSEVPEVVIQKQFDLIELNLSPLNSGPKITSVTCKRKRCGWMAWDQKRGSFISYAKILQGLRPT